MPSKKFLREFYEAEGFDHDHEEGYCGEQINWLYGMRVYWLKQFYSSLIKSERFHSILDLGCGDGALAKRILEAHGEQEALMGVDLAVNHLKRAKARLPKGAFVLADAEALPFTDHAFDLVICSELLEHLINPSKAVSEISRVSRRYALVTIPTPSSSWLARLLSLVDRERFSSKARLRLPGHLWFFSIKEVLELFSNATFSVNRLRGIGIFMLHYEVLTFIPAAILIGIYRLNKVVDVFLNRFPVFRANGYISVLLFEKQ